MKSFNVEIPDNIGDRHDLTCDICGKLCLNKAGKFKSYEKSPYQSTNQLQNGLTTIPC